uniref:Uncharacterized protein n=1 Tax=Arundo donax TaxID=35708 RepID=A0A0A9CTR4_ARUDO
MPLRRVKLPQNATVMFSLDFWLFFHFLPREMTHVLPWVSLPGLSCRSCFYKLAWFNLVNTNTLLSMMSENPPKFNQILCAEISIVLNDSVYFSIFVAL